MPHASGAWTILSDSDRSVDCLRGPFAFGGRLLRQLRNVGWVSNPPEGNCPEIGPGEKSPRSLTCQLESNDNHTARGAPRANFRRRVGQGMRMRQTRGTPPAKGRCPLNFRSSRRDLKGDNEKAPFPPKVSYRVRRIPAKIDQITPLKYDKCVCTMVDRRSPSQTGYRQAPTLYRRPTCFQESRP